MGLAGPLDEDSETHQDAGQSRRPEQGRLGKFKRDGDHTFTNFQPT